MSMWQIYEKKSVIKALAKMPKLVLQHYEIWKRILEHEGPKGLKLIKGFHDEVLKGEWAGYRSSRLTLQWRVIYKLEQGAFEVYVIDVNAHDYRRK